MDLVKLGIYNHIASDHTEVIWRICMHADTPIIGSDNGLSPIWRQAIIWTNADLLSIWSSYNGSTPYWPPGLLHTLDAGGHI